MIKLYDKETSLYIGEITEEQLQFLIDNLEEESSTDVDYYIHRTTLDIFQEQGGDMNLIKMIRDALGEREDMEIRYEKQ